MLPIFLDNWNNSVLYVNDNVPIFEGLLSQCEVCGVPICDRSQFAAQHQAIWENSLHAQVSDIHNQNIC